MRGLDSTSGNGLSRPNVTAACISSRTFAAIASASSAVSVPSATSRPRNAGTGSPCLAASYSSGAPNFSIASCSGKWSGTPGGAMMLPCAERRYICDSTSVGPSPARARATAAPTVS